MITVESCGECKKYFLLVKSAEKVIKISENHFM